MREVRAQVAQLRSQKKTLREISEIVGLSTLRVATLIAGEKFLAFMEDRRQRKLPEEDIEVLIKQFEAPEEKPSEPEKTKRATKVRNAVRNPS